MVSITGSTRAGIAVATAAAADVKVAHLELGGKAPVVVFNDADLPSAVEGIRVAGYFNGGQDCTAATRVLCQSGIYDEFVAELARRRPRPGPVMTRMTRICSTGRSTTSTSCAMSRVWWTGLPIMPGL